MTAEATGRPSYHPSGLLKLYIYGYLNRVQSSRRLEREAVSVSLARPCDRAAEPCVVRGHHLHSGRPRLSFTSSRSWWASRAVLSWRLSNTMDASFCIEALREALARFGKPDIFNTDQGSQFTSGAFTGVLIAAGVRISMDGRGAFSTTCSSSGRGARSSMRMSTSRAMPTAARPAPASRRGSVFTMAGALHQAHGGRTPMAVWRAGTTGELGDRAVGMWASVLQRQRGRRCNWP